MKKKNFKNVSFSLFFLILILISCGQSINYQLNPYFVSKIDLVIDGNKTEIMNENVEIYFVQGGVKGNKKYDKLNLNSEKVIIAEPIYGGPKIRIKFKEEFCKLKIDKRLSNGIIIKYGNWGNFGSKTKINLKIYINTKNQVIEVIHENSTVGDKRSHISDYNVTHKKEVSFKEISKHNEIVIFDGV